MIFGFLVGDNSRIIWKVENDIKKHVDDKPNAADKL